MMRFWKLMIMICVLFTSTTSWAVNDLLVSDNYGGKVVRYSFNPNGSVASSTPFISLIGATGMRINPMSGELLVSGTDIVGFDVNNDPIYEGVVNRYNAQTGQYINRFAQGLSSPADVRIGPDNRVYVSDFNTNQIRIYEQNGNPFATLNKGSSNLTNPNFMAWDSSNRLYVSSFGSDEVYRYNTTSSAFETFITAGNNTLDGPTGLIFLGSNLMVASVWNGKLLTYSDTGSPLATTGPFPSYTNPYYNPNNPISSLNQPLLDPNPSDLMFLTSGPFAGDMLVSFLGQGAVTRLGMSGGGLYAGGDGSVFTPSQLLEVAAIPEPSTWALLGLGACVVYRQRRRLSRKTKLV